MEIIKQIIAKDKIERVIDSCVTQEQFTSAKKMVDLYYKKFEDFIGYNHLLWLINKTK